MDLPPGLLLQVIGAGHAAVGLTIHRRAWEAVVRDGVLDAVTDGGERAFAFWFLLLAPVTWVAGRALVSVEQHDDRAAARHVGTVLATTGLVGGAMGPWQTSPCSQASARRPRVDSAVPE